MPFDIAFNLFICFVAASALKRLSQLAADFDSQLLENTRDEKRD